MSQSQYSQKTEAYGGFDSQNAEYWQEYPTNQDAYGSQNAYPQDQRYNGYPTEQDGGCYPQTSYGCENCNPSPIATSEDTGRFVKFVMEYIVGSVPNFLGTENCAEKLNYIQKVLMDLCRNEIYELEKKSMTRKKILSQCKNIERLVRNQSPNIQTQPSSSQKSTVSRVKDYASVVGHDPRIQNPPKLIETPNPTETPKPIETAKPTEDSKPIEGKKHSCPALICIHIIGINVCCVRLAAISKTFNEYTYASLSCHNGKQEEGSWHVYDKNKDHYKLDAIDLSKEEGSEKETFYVSYWNKYMYWFVDDRDAIETYQAIIRAISEKYSGKALSPLSPKTVKTLSEVIRKIWTLK